MAMPVSTIWLAGILVVLSGCLLPDRRPAEPKREDVEAAETMPRYFQGCIAAGEYQKAYTLLSVQSRGLVSYFEFCQLFSQFSAVRRLVSGWEIVEVLVEDDHGVLALYHRDFGIRLEVPIRRQTIREPREMTLWSFDFSRKEYGRYITTGRQWYERQLRDLGGRLYAVPPWWRYRTPSDDAPRYVIDAGQ